LCWMGVADIGRNDFGSGFYLCFRTSLADRGEAPSVVALMNGGVLLSLEGTSTCESLEKLKSFRQARRDTEKLGVFLIDEEVRLGFNNIKSLQLT